LVDVWIPVIVGVGVDVIVDVAVTVGVTDPVVVIVGVGLGVISERIHTWTDVCRPAVIGTSDTWPLEYTGAWHTTGDGASGPGVGVAVPITVQKGTSAVGPHRSVSPWVGSHMPSSKASTTKVTTPAGSPVIITRRRASVSKGFFASARQQVVLEGKALETDCSTTRTVSTLSGIGVLGVNPEQGSAFWDCAASVCQRTRTANSPAAPLPALPEPPQPTAHAVRASSTRRAFLLSEMDRSPRRASARLTSTSYGCEASV